MPKHIHTEKKTNISYTEKKRIRKNFGKHLVTMEAPNLLAIQTESYHTFLQAEVAIPDRKNIGLQAALTSVFPIESIAGNARLEFVSYSFGEIPFDVRECQARGLNYSVPLRVKTRLVIYEKDGEHGHGSKHKNVNVNIKDIKEQEVFLGDIPLMTTTGSFGINGIERVVV